MSRGQGIYDNEDRGETDGGSVGAGDESRDTATATQQDTSDVDKSAEEPTA
jgi:hypothetical protein